MIRLTMRGCQPVQLEESAMIYRNMSHAVEEWQADECGKIESSAIPSNYDFEKMVKQGWRGCYQENRLKREHRCFNYNITAKGDSTDLEDKVHSLYRLVDLRPVSNTAPAVRFQQVWKRDNAHLARHIMEANNISVNMRSER
jgi:hypothetical protein